MKKRQISKILMQAKKVNTIIHELRVFFIDNEMAHWTAAELEETQIVLKALKHYLAHLRGKVVFSVNSVIIDR